MPESSKGKFVFAIRFLNTNVDLVVAADRVRALECIEEAAKGEYKGRDAVLAVAVASASINGTKKAVSRTFGRNVDIFPIDPLDLVSRS